MKPLPPSCLYQLIIHNTASFHQPQSLILLLIGHVLEFSLLDILTNKPPLQHVPLDILAQQLQLQLVPLNILISNPQLKHVPLVLSQYFGNHCYKKLKKAILESI
jgi:hypothetical protein